MGRYAGGNPSSDDSYHQVLYHQLYAKIDSALSKGFQLLSLSVRVGGYPGLIATTADNTKNNLQTIQQAGEQVAKDYASM